MTCGLPAAIGRLIAARGVLLLLTRHREAMAVLEAAGVTHHPISMGVAPAPGTYAAPGAASWNPGTGWAMAGFTDGEADHEDWVGDARQLQQGPASRGLPRPDAPRGRLSQEPRVRAQSGRSHGGAPDEQRDNLAPGVGGGGTGADLGLGLSDPKAASPVAGWEAASGEGAIVQRATTQLEPQAEGRTACSRGRRG